MLDRVPYPQTLLTSGVVRAVRASTVTVMVVAIAVGCHAAAGGAIPPVWVIGTMILVAAPLCWSLSARRWSVRDLLAIFLLAQSAVHLLSMISAPASMTMDMSGPLGVSGSMLTSHVIGAVLLIVLVRRGEHSLWSVVNVLALRVVVLQGRQVAPAVAARLPVAAELGHAVSEPWLEIAADRGPPRCGPRQSV